MLDRVAPPAPVVAARTVGASTVLAITPAADPPPGSGVVGFVASYRTAANAALRSLRVAAADRELRARGTRAVGKVLERRQRLEERLQEVLDLRRRRPP